MIQSIGDDRSDFKLRMIAFHIGGLAATILLPGRRREVSAVPIHTLSSIYNTSPHDDLFHSLYMRSSCQHP